MPSIQDFRNTHASVAPKSDIVERWHSRVVPQGWHTRGRAGAEAYIGKFLVGAKAPKAIGFARMAEIQGVQEMANRFWEEAYYLETGHQARLDGTVTAAVEADVPQVRVREGFGRNPQLPIFVDESEIVAKMLDDGWGMQVKHDGRNAMVRFQNGQISGGGKKGLATVVPLAVIDAVKTLGDIDFDAENVNGVFHMFDVVSIAGEDLRSLSYEDRHERMLEATKTLDPKGALRTTRLIKGRKAKKAYETELIEGNKEGFILKRLSAEYVEGDSHGNQVKKQFRARNSFIIGKRNGAKESVQLFVYEGGDLRNMGNVTMIGKTIPPEGTVAEILYLYVYRGPTGKAIQPEFLHVRDDAVATDCQYSKLKLKEQGEE